MSLEEAVTTAREIVFPEDPEVENISVRMSVADLQELEETLKREKFFYLALCMWAIYEARRIGAVLEQRKWGKVW